MARALREDLKQRIRDANDIVDVVGAVVNLKRAGKSHTGLCPFHNDTTPSFNVNSEWQTFKCWSCDESGDVFSFVQKTEHVEFKEALAILADRAGIEMEYSDEARKAAAGTSPAGTFRPRSTPTTGARIRTTTTIKN